MRDVRAKSAQRASVLVLFALALVLWAVAPAGAAALSRSPRPSPARVLRRATAPKQPLVNALTEFHARSETGGAPATQTGRAPSESGHTAAARLPRPVEFREAEGRGLLVRTWVNGSGAYTFAIDTGAGANIISPRVAREARVALMGGEKISIGGLSGMTVAAGARAIIRTLALGEPDNTLPVNGLTIVAEGLPSGLDGILDPSETLAPLGYVLDMPNNLVSFFDPRRQPLRQSDARADETVVAWLTDGASRRPFVMLTGGRRALLDTGSGFGLALTTNAARSIGIPLEGGRERGETRDIAGGRVEARRIRPATVYVGELALRRVPTDLLLNAKPDAPVLLGRDALRPFQLTFDPLSRLIRIKVV